MSQSPIAAGATFALATLFALDAGTVEAGHHSRNISIDDGDYATECGQVHVRFSRKAAGGEDAAPAEAAPKQIALSVKGDEIDVAGPGNDSDWSAFLLIQAPRKALDVRATNGPLTLKMPDSYESGVLVEASAHSPLRCSAGPCSSARREGDEFSPRRLEKGSGAAVVRLSTTNGPVSIVAGN